MRSQRPKVSKSLIWAEIVVIVIKGIGQMTLLLTEIHVHKDHEQDFIVFAADRRIGDDASRKVGSRQKIFRIRHLNSGIGYFGLAAIPRSSRGSESMDSWLRAFIDASVKCESLETFAQSLTLRLNRVTGEWGKTRISGFHIAGFNKEGTPEFWYVRNVADDRRTLFGRYDVREDFQRRDAKEVEPNGVATYRNGEIHAHVAAWKGLDKTLGTLIGHPGFKGINGPKDYIRWVKFKMNFIAQFYENWCTISIIGTPVDAFSITRPTRYVRPKLHQGTHNLLL